MTHSNSEAITRSIQSSDSASFRCGSQNLLEFCSDKIQRRPSMSRSKASSELNRNVNQEGEPQENCWADHTFASEIDLGSLCMFVCRPCPVIAECGTAPVRGGSNGNCNRQCRISARPTARNPSCARTGINVVLWDWNSLQSQTLNCLHKVLRFMLPYCCEIQPLHDFQIRLHPNCKVGETRN